MKISGVSCETKFRLLFFLGHPTPHVLSTNFYHLHFSLQTNAWRNFPWQNGIFANVITLTSYLFFSKVMRKKHLWSYNKHSILQRVCLFYYLFINSVLRVASLISDGIFYKMRMHKESWKRISANKVRNDFYEPKSVYFLIKKKYHSIILCGVKENWEIEGLYWPKRSTPLSCILDNLWYLGYHYPYWAFQHNLNI